MITDRYDPMNLFELAPKLGLEMEPELVELDRLLEDDVLFQAVRADLSRRYPNSAIRGRHSTPVEVILRMLVVRRLYDWSYEQTEHFVSDSLVLRQFCRLYLEKAPDHSTLDRWAGLIEPTTLERLGERVVEQLACRLKVTRGRKLRSDGTVVGTLVHHPTDSSLLADGVRVLCRLMRRAKGVIGQAEQLGPGVFRDRTGSARRLNREIARAAGWAAQGAGEVRKAAYRHLIEVARSTIKQTKVVGEHLADCAERGAEGLLRGIQHFLPMVERVVGQTSRRVLAGQTVPASEKLLSLFEPHTAIIKRGKAGKEAEFGRKVWLDEVDGGIVSSYRILAGSPPEAGQAIPSLREHKRRFGRAPHLFAADRGVYSPEAEQAASQMGVARVAMPKPGARDPERVRHEHQGWFRRAMRFRAGVEGRISVLKRRGFLGRCRERGEAGFEPWIGWGVLTANLSTIARVVSTR